MNKIIAVLGFFLLATSCASTHMKQYIGKDIREVVIADGPPINAFDYGQGRRVFQFRWGGGTYAFPQSTTTTGNVTVTGNAAWYQKNTISSGGGVVTSEGCILSYITEWNEQSQSWIVTKIRVPDQAVC